MEGKLSQDRINRLNDIGFEWTLSRRGSRKRASKRSNRNRETESDDEVDEIGALIYDQAMRQRTAS